MSEKTSPITQGTVANMTHGECISKIRNRQLARLLDDIGADDQPEMLIRSIKRSFNFMANDIETYVTTVTQGIPNDTAEQNDIDGNR